MTRIPPLPFLMVAPNGARRGKSDHPNIPITVSEIVETAISCASAGADGIHLHVRDAKGQHTLDAGLYRELLSELAQAVPNLSRQITTEAVGIYSPEQQRDLVKSLKPDAVSISISEMHSEQNLEEVYSFYQWCLEENIAVQHILYGPEDLMLFDRLLAQDELPPHTPQLLFVLGRYAPNQESLPCNLNPFTKWLADQKQCMDWAACAFGVGETQSLAKAHSLGGKLRVGFENSIWNSDGSTATDNAQRVKTLKKILQ